MLCHSMDRSAPTPPKGPRASARRPSGSSSPVRHAAAREVLGELFSPSLSFEAREALAETFAAALSGGVFCPLLVEKLRTGEEDDRVIAALALAWRGNRNALSALGLGLEDPVLRVRMACARALGEVGEAQAAALLLSALERDPAPALRLALLSSLRRLQHPRGDEALLGALVEGGAEAQLGALVALSQRPTASSVPWLRPLLGAPDARVRALAVSLLERVGDACDLDRVRSLVDDDNPRVRALARDAAVALARRASALAFAG